MPEDDRFGVPASFKFFFLNIVVYGFQCNASSVF